MFLALPDKCKLSKVLSTDKHRPILGAAELREVSPGEWELAGTDSYKLARIPLTLKDGPTGTAPVAGSISADALRAIEKNGARCFTATADTVTPCNRYGVPVGPAYPRPDIGRHPAWNQLTPDTGTGDFVIGVNAKYLHDLAASLGSDTVSLTFVTGANGAPDPRRPFTVAPIHGGGAGTGIIMPVRVKV
jgi:DNA polymerase III sliding clamp (beta) subunit (PCNA family)